MDKKKQQYIIDSSNNDAISSIVDADTVNIADNHIYFYLEERLVGVVNTDNIVSVIEAKDNKE
jgi:hypothetical protein